MLRYMYLPKCLSVLIAMLISVTAAAGTPSRAPVNAQEKRHLFILAGGDDMEALDPAKHFTPVVEATLGKGTAIVVKSARGGQPIHRWYRDMRWGAAQEQPEGAGVLFGNLLQRDIDKALADNRIASADVFDTVTLVWVQGRNDAVEPHAKSYLERFKGLVRQLKLYRKRHDLQVVIARINDHKSDSQAVQEVRQAQVQAATELPRAAWVDTDDLNGADNHASLTPEGYTMLGSRLAEASVELIKKAPKKTHLFILSGQSNMYNLKEGYFTPYVEALYGKRNVTVVKRAQGGQSIRRWYKKWAPADEEPFESAGDLYDVLLEAVRKEAAGRTYDTVTFVWMQGESDCSPQRAAVYGESLKGVLQQLADDLGRKDIHVVIGRINHCKLEGNAGKQMVREVQVHLAKDLPSATWVNTDDLCEGAGVHMNKDGYRKLGMRFAKGAATLIATQTEVKWDERLNDMIALKVSLPKDQRIAHEFDQDGKIVPSEGWTSIGKPGPDTREWRYQSLDPVNDVYTTPYWLDPNFKVISLPANLQGWMWPSFDDSTWQKGAAPIGRGVTFEKEPKVVNRSDWGKGEYLVARSTFEVDHLDYSKFRLSILCRHANQVYLNGHRIRSYPWGKPLKYFAIPLNESEAIYLKPGKNVVAIYTNSGKKEKNSPTTVDLDIEGFSEK